jgi:hypothetical protein
MLSSWRTASESEINVMITAIKNVFMRVVRQNWHRVEVETEPRSPGIPTGRATTRPPYYPDRSVADT